MINIYIYNLRVVRAWEVRCGKDNSKRRTPKYIKHMCYVCYRNMKNAKKMLRRQRGRRPFVAGAFSAADASSLHPLVIVCVIVISIVVIISSIMIIIVSSSSSSSTTLHSSASTLPEPLPLRGATQRCSPKKEERHE